MKTVSSLLDEEWHKRYRSISKLNIRSSIYDVTNRCNLRCKAASFFPLMKTRRQKEEMDLKKWEEFIDREKERGGKISPS